ncbi:MAG TPA: hypothetical protein VFP84_22865 [Kofleriaceae bacterium]|nr:hypothetical protein [Kofleriaceae bacterium]
MALWVSASVLAASCGVGAPDESVVESALSAAILSPVQGDCTSTQTLNRITVGGSDVIRGECSVTCNKNAFQMGVWNVGVVKPDGSEPMASNLGAGPTRTQHVDVPYVAGFYSVACTTMWQEKSGSTSFFDQGFPFVGGNF